jgi:hypothetical protein
MQQRWHMVDHDRGLLAAIEHRCHGQLPATPAIAWQPHHADLQADLEAVMARPADLVTTSAFLDLASIAWIERLAHTAAAARRPVYAALIYDGRIACEPADPFDAQALLAFNAHQRRDKGFGPAAGPLAASRTSDLLVARGFTVRRATADWSLGEDDALLQEEFVQGWHRAACEQDALDRRALDRWLARRLESIRAGHSRIVVGHSDIWAYPSTAGARSRSKSIS